MMRSRGWLRPTSTSCLSCALALLLSGSWLTAQDTPPPQTTVTVDGITWQMPRPVPGTRSEIPRDGVTPAEARCRIAWSGKAGLTQSLPVHFRIVDGPGQFEVPLHELVLAASPRIVDVTYTQPAGQASPEDTLVTAEAVAQQASARSALTLRGVQLAATKQHDRELYSGTGTRRACCAVFVKAFCPANGALRPQGKVTARVADGQEGVFLKWFDAESQQMRWTKRHEAVLSRDPRDNSVSTDFTVATDNAEDLPDRPIPEATVTFALNGARSPVRTKVTFSVLVPVKPVINARTYAVREGRNFSGSLTWYADEACTKYYYGAKGTIRWELPRRTDEREYQLDTHKEAACPFSSLQAAVPGYGAFIVTEEHGYQSPPHKVHVAPTTRDRAWGQPEPRYPYGRLGVPLGALDGSF